MRLNSAKAVVLFVGMLGLASASAQEVFQNNRNSQYQTGIGQLMVTAMQQGHPACLQRLTSTYSLASPVLVSRTGRLDDLRALDEAATEAYICGRALSDLVSAIRLETIGLRSRAALSTRLAELLRAQLGKQAKLNWEALAANGGLLQTVVQQDPGYQRPYYKFFAGANRQPGLGETKDSATPNLYIEGGKQDDQTLEFQYYAVTRVTGFSAADQNFLLSYKDGALKILQGGRPWFDLAADIVGGTKITFDESGAISFEVLK